jgi:MFS transporter, Spinster family, sphingosine-1-phosphate transporter
MVGAAPDIVAPVRSDTTGETRKLGSGAIRNPAAILALLTGLNLLNYIDRFVMSAVLPRVQDDLHLSNFLGGALYTVLLIGYFATSPIFGTWGDRVGTDGRKRLMMLGVSVWSAATVASGLAHSAASLLVARAVVGVGEASYATIAPTLIDDLASPARKGRWMAIFNAAIPMGSALGYIVGGAVEQSHGWQSAFFVAGGPGIVLALLCLLIVEPPRQGASASPDMLGSVRVLLRLRAYRLATLGYCAYTFALGGFAYWAPKYLNQVYGLEAGYASVAFGKITVATGLVGTLTGGWLADRAVRRRSEADPNEAFVRGSLTVCALSAGLGAPLAMAAILAPTHRGFFAFVIPCELALFLSSGPVNVALIRSAPAGLRASAMALSIFAIHLLGDLWSPLLIGLVADHAPMRDAMLAAPIAFVLAAVLWGWGVGARWSATAVGAEPLLRRG